MQANDGAHEWNFQRGMTWARVGKREMEEEEEEEDSAVLTGRLKDGEIDGV